VGFDSATRSLGVQAVLLVLAGSNGVRVRYMPGLDGWSVGWFVTYKLPVIWVWSR
jgi:hypothetical protein